MKTTVLSTLSGEGFDVPIYRDEDGCVRFTSDADIDVDGSGQSHGDPYYQPDTTLHHNGKPLNADEESFIVVPPVVIKAVLPVVLGCRARVTYRGKSCEAVVGDVGPTRKTGEISRALALKLSINPSPISGGVDDPVVLYELWPGKAALVDGRQYKLQPYRA